MGGAEREIDFHEFAYRIVEAGTLKFVRQAGKLEAQAEFLCYSLEAELFLQSVLLRPSIDWVTCERYRG